MMTAVVRMTPRSSRAGRRRAKWAPAKPPTTAPARVTVRRSGALRGLLETECEDWDRAGQAWCRGG